MRAKLNLRELGSGELGPDHVEPGGAARRAVAAAACEPELIGAAGEAEAALCMTV